MKTSNAPLLDPVPSTSILFKGTRIDGRYRIERKIGAGGVGTVYLVEHLETGKPMAVKLLHTHRRRHDRHRERLFREVAVMSSIRAFNVVRVFDHGTFQGQPYSVMEYLPGVDLRQRLRRDAWLGWSEAREILRQIIHGLSAAYDFGVLHRDIKPSNVFLMRTKRGEPPRVKLLDFGLAKASDTTSPLGKPLTQSGIVMGTVCYLAPERLRGEPATVRSEIYSLGVLAFECLAGRPPLPVANRTELIRRRIYEPPPSIRRLVPGLPRAVDELLLRAMAQDPARRFEAFAELEAALLAIPAAASSKPWLLSARKNAEPRPPLPPMARPPRPTPSSPTVPVKLPSIWRKTQAYGAGSDGLDPLPARTRQRSAQRTVPEDSRGRSHG